jgi:hypothetical protein
VVTVFVTGTVAIVRAIVEILAAVAIFNYYKPKTKNKPPHR